MLFKFIALSAFASTVLSQATPTANLPAVLSVLETALPSSILNEAFTNSPAVSSMIASEFAAGSTPGWFSSLPTFVKTYLDPAVASATGSAMSGSMSGSMASSMASAASSSASAAAAGTSSSAAGAVPTAVVGMGLAGAVGLVGILVM